jgi:hypothetical protein
MKKTSYVIPDKFTDYVSNSFDYEFTGMSEFELPAFEKPTEEFSIGVVYGSSGSGKTQLLKRHFNWNKVNYVPDWDTCKAIVSNFGGMLTPEEVVEALCGVGLASVPTWCKPYCVLSNGEAYRADVARMLTLYTRGIRLDEFTSEVNRETAKSLSTCLSKYIRKKGITNVVIATCHKDVIPWLEPDWVFNCDDSTMALNDIKPKLKKIANIEIL